MQHSYCPCCMMPVEPGQKCGYCGCDTSSFRSEPHHIPAGTLLQDRFWVGRSLGEGGFGITYLGRDIKLDRRVAIKEYYPRTLVRRDSGTTLRVTCYTGSDPHFQKGVEQFLTEAKTLARLEDIPEIVKVIDYFPENDTAYIVMEYLDGTTLAHYGIRPANELFGMLMPVMKAMDAMHQEGVIHRDISPDNLMVLKKNGQVKLMDFGCARELTGRSTMTIQLKPGFAPPEQYTGHEQGPWTDVYGLCATIYYCITGKLPPEATHRLVRDELIPPSQLCEGILPHQEQALVKGLAVMVENRWQSAAQLYQALYDPDSVVWQTRTPDPIGETTVLSPDYGYLPISQNGAAVTQTGPKMASTEYIPASTPKSRPGSRAEKAVAAATASAGTPLGAPHKKEKKKKKKGIGTFLLLLLLLGGAAAFWFLHPHQFGEWTVAKAATCMETGLEQRKCFCGETQQQVLEIVDHTPVVDEAVPATCISTGLTEGSHCSVCGEVFTAPKETPMTAHDIVTLKAVPPTCTETGLSEGVGCSYCDYIQVPQETVEALGHNPVVTPAVEATCQTEGKTEGVHCDRCGMVIAPQLSTPKTAHDPVTDPAVAATCSSTGKTQGSHCAVCGTVISAQNTTPKTDHTPESVPAVAPTCSSTGKTEGTRCAVCGITLEGQDTVPKIAHTPVTDPAVAPTCSSTGKTEGSHCSVCGAVIKAQESVPTIAHTPVTDPAVPATCTSEGLSEGSHCAVCGVVLVEQTVVEGKTGHDISAIGYCNNCGQPQWSMSLSITPHYDRVSEDGALSVTISYQLHGLDPNYTGSFSYRQYQTGQSMQSGSIGCTKDGDSGSFTIRLYNWQGTTLSFSVYSDSGFEIASCSSSF
ncbi:MAG: protein kinase [Oscillospiraceae bacterium]|nr:protein kinase [Oscillospiraceae bacterium]